jgi:hypothetical protein
MCVSTLTLRTLSSRDRSGRATVIVPAEKPVTSERTGTIRSFASEGEAGYAARRRPTERRTTSRSMGDTSTAATMIRPAVIGTALAAKPSARDDQPETRPDQ